MANTTDYTRLLDGYALLAIKAYIANNYAAKSHTHDDRYLKLTGGKLTGSLEINSTGSSWSEGIRIHPSSNNWGGIVLCEASNSGATGTSAKTWSMHNNEGVFGFYQNGSNIGSVTAGLSYSGQWIMKNGNGNQILFPTAAGTIALVGNNSHTHTKSQITDFPTSMPANGGNSDTVDGYHAEQLLVYANYKYHDIAAFCNAATPLYEVSSNGSSGWAEATLNKDIFAAKENFSTNVTSTTQMGARFTWKSGISWSSICYAIIGWTYQATPATVTLKFESSADSGSTWTDRGTITGITTNASPALYSFSNPNGDAWFRVSIIQTSSTGSKNISTIKLLTARWGDQGLGSEYEKPYVADGNKNIRPWANNSQDLGSSSYKWKTMHAVTIYENGTALSSKYLGISATAADSTKLNGQAASYYLNYNNFTNTPTIPTKSSWNYDDVYVKYSAAQSLTDAQKTQARSNIGAGTSSFTGYTSSNKLHTDYINNAAGWTSVTETTVTNWGFTKNAGTVTQVKVGTTAYNPSSGVVSLPAYPTKSSWNYDDVYVKLTGNQSISGTKTFTGKITLSDGQNSYTFIPGQGGDAVLELVDEQDNKTTVYLANPNTPSTAQYIALRSWVSDNYLGKTAKAADADKLDGNDSSYFINTSNIGSQSVYHSDVSDYATDAGYATNSASLGGNGPAYYLNYNNFTNKPSAVLYTSQSLTDAQKTQARSNIGAGTSSLAIGTTASTAAAGNHTHTLSIASGGTASINLAANTTYTLTAGGKTYAFKTPPASSAYYSNQYNNTYYLSSNSGASLWAEDIQAGNAIVGLQGGNASIMGIGWPGLASGSFKRSLLFTGNRVDLTLTDSTQNYLKGLSIDMYDDDYYTLHIRANDYSDLYGSVDAENYANINLHAYSFVYTPYSTNSAVTNDKFVRLGVTMHNINYTYSSTVLLKMNIRGRSATDNAITSYATLCGLLYNAGHRSAATCLTCSGRYSSSSYVVLGVYATGGTSGLYLVYCSASSNTVNTLSIASGTVTDTLSVSLVP